MKIRLYIYSLITTIVSLCWQPAMANPHGSLESVNRVGGSTCIVTTYSPEYRWSSRVITHVQNQLMSSYSGSVSTINIPLVSINSKAELEKRLLDLHNMLNTVKPKRVILVGSSSFCLCEKINEWYPDIAMLLIGGQDYTGKIDFLTSGTGLIEGNTVPVAEMRKKYNISLQCMPVYLDDEVKLMRQLLPQLKNLYFVGGDDQFSTSKGAELMRIVKSRQYPIRVIQLLAHEMSLDSLVSTLSRLNPKTDAVIYSSWVNRVAYKESPVLMSRSLFFLNVSAAPIFIMREYGWMEDSQDILGGSFLDEDDFYRHLDRVLTMFAGGIPARNIPQYKPGKPIVKLNYTRLLAYGIDPNVCPEETIFTCKPLNMWEQYHNEITVIGIFFLFLLIVLLVRAYKNSVTIRRMQVNELEAMEAELEAKRKNSEFIENMPVAYMRCKIEADAAGVVNDVRVIMCNKDMREKWARKGVAVEDKTFAEMIPLAAPSFVYKIQRARNDNRTVMHSTFYLPDTGQYIYMLVYFYDSDNIAVLMRDDTEITRSARSLKEAKERAERSERIKREFINNMTHEVRTPLNAICGFTELLTNPDASSTLSLKEQAEMKKNISVNTQHLVEMLTNILEYSDIVNGTSKADITLCHIVDLARKAIQQMEQRQDSDVKVELKVCVDSDAEMRMCESRVQMVLSCLISNAIKFTKKGSIVLSVEKNEETGKYRYVCTDTGCGIPEEKREYIFADFTQIDRFSQGTGIGLALCRLIADEMDGKIYLDAEYKEGARFVFELP